VPHAKTLDPPRIFPHVSYKLTFSRLKMVSTDNDGEQQSKNAVDQPIDKETENVDQSIDKETENVDHAIVIKTSQDAVAEPSDPRDEEEAGVDNQIEEADSEDERQHPISYTEHEFQFAQVEQVQYQYMTIVCDSGLGIISHYFKMISVI